MEADRRLALHGANDALSRRERRSPWRSLLARLHNPLILVLLLASGFAAAAGEVASFAITSVMIVLGVLLDFLQEMRADHTVDALRRSVALRASVLRDGHEASVPIERLVPGDVIRLAPGDVVPADARLLETQELHVDEALLTGEPYPALKHAEAGELDGGGASAGMVFMGTSVISGAGSALVMRTGRATALGDLAETLARQRAPDAFEIGVRRFGMLILRVTVLLVLTVLAVSLFVHRPWLESLMFALALAVGLTPELLPMIVTVTLATGAKRLLRRQVIVKRLAAVHDLGRLDVLCTDKTGTLTDAIIRLAAHVDVDGRSSDRVLHLAQLNSAFSGGVRSALDVAIMAAAPSDDDGWRKCGEVPFDFERRRASILLASGDARLLVLKGAPEDVLRCCTDYEAPSGAIVPLDDATRTRLAAAIDRLGEGGYRVLGVASASLPAGTERISAAGEEGLVFGGFVTFVDPPKQGAAAALHGLIRAGVAIKVLTGDTAAVARHVCAELGLAVGEVLTGAEIERLGDEALVARLPSTTLFCRVTPQQKRRIVMLLKRRGLVVGFLGDGINDTAALREADVGISVDTAADVAKEAADLILLKRDLKPIYDGVLEGRRAVQNAMKYVLMASSSNFGNMISMALAAVFMPFLPMLPIQVLLNNLLYDVSELALPGDRVDLSALRRPVAWDMHRVARYMLVFGVLSSVFDAITFSILIFVFDADMALFRTGWFIESLATQVLVIFVLRTSLPFWRGRPSVGLTALSLSVVALACALPLTPLGPVLGFREPPASFFIFLALMTGAYLVMAEFAKRLLVRRFPPPREGVVRWPA